MNPEPDLDGFIDYIAAQTVTSELEPEMLAARAEILAANPDVTIAGHLAALLPEHLRSTYWHWTLTRYVESTDPDGAQ